MLRFLKAALRGVAMAFGATLVAGVGFTTWFARSWLEGWLERSFDAEAAERRAEQVHEAQAVEAQAQVEADRDNAAARHEESVAVAEAQLEETRALRDELRQAERARKAAARQPRAPETTARPPRWEPDEPEPEGGAPAPAFA